MWKITNEYGNSQIDFNPKIGKTQKICNGGEAYRENAYLDLENAKIFNFKDYLND